MLNKNISRSILVGLIGLSFVFAGNSFSRANDTQVFNTQNKIYNQQVMRAAPSGYTEITSYGTQGLVITTIATNEISAAVHISMNQNGSADSYYIGYNSTNETYASIAGHSDLKGEPAKLVYNVKKNGATEQRESPVNLISSNGIFDGIGSIGDTMYASDVDIKLVPGEELLEDEFYLINLYKLEKNAENVFYPDLGDKSYIKGEKSAIFKKQTMSSFLSIDYKGSASFNGNTFYRYTINSFGKDIYRDLSSTYKRLYDNNEENILKGVSWVRTRLYFSPATRFVFTLNDDTEVSVPSKVNISTINVTEKDSNLNLNMDDYTVVDGKTYDLRSSNVKDVKIYNFYVYVDIYDSDTVKSISKSNYSIRFSYMNTKMADVTDVSGGVGVAKSENSINVSGNLILYGSLAAVTVIYAAIAIIMYFYTKKKYINDEFKRVRTGPYVKTALMGYFTVAFLVLALESIIFRGTILNNSLQSFNSIDVYIIVFTIASLILVGYFIRYFVIQFKNIQEKRRNDKTNKKGNRSEDGTISLKK